MHELAGAPKLMAAISSIRFWHPIMSWVAASLTDALGLRLKMLNGYMTISGKEQRFIFINLSSLQGGALLSLAFVGRK